MNAISDTRAPAEPVVLAARRWLTPVREQLAEQFLSAYITGGALNEGFDPGQRHVNVLVVAEDLSIGRLEALAAKVPQTKQAPHIDPLFMTHQQIQRSLDVFPIEWLDVQERHYTMEGVDLFTTIEVPQTYLRLQIEQELRGKYLRLTQGFLTGASHAEHLHATLARLASGFHTLFRALIRLREEAPPSSLERVISRVAELYDLDAEALSGAHRMRAQRRHPGVDETRAIYRSFLTQIERLTSAVDGLRLS